MTKMSLTVKAIVLSTFTALGAASVFAEIETVNGYTWTYCIADDTAEIDYGLLTFGRQI